MSRSTVQLPVTAENGAFEVRGLPNISVIRESTVHKLITLWSLQIYHSTVYSLRDLSLRKDLELQMHRSSSSLGVESPYDTQESSQEALRAAGTVAGGSARLQGAA